MIDYSGMTRDELFNHIVNHSYDWEEDKMQAALTQLEKLERESCAQIAYEVYTSQMTTPGKQILSEWGRQEITAAIRARGEK